MKDYPSQDFAILYSHGSTCTVHVQRFIKVVYHLHVMKMCCDVLIYHGNTTANTCLKLST